MIFITDNLENCLKLSYSYRLATHWRGKLITSVRINSSCRTIKVDQKVKIYISRKRCKHIFFGDKFEFFSFYVSVSDLSSWNLTIQRQQVITPNGSWIMPNGSRVMSNGSRIIREPLDMTREPLGIIHEPLGVMTCCRCIVTDHANWLRTKFDQRRNSRRRTHNPSTYASNMLPTNNNSTRKVGKTVTGATESIMLLLLMMESFVDCNF